MARKKKSSDIGLLEVAGDLLERILWLLAGIYIFLVMVVMPFYNTNGYARIGTNKYEFFKMITGGMAWFFLPVLAAYFIYLFLKWKKDKQSVRWNLSVTDKFALLYAVAVLLSYLLSEYRELTPYGDAWKGASGWYMGTLSQLTFVATYFIVSRFWKGTTLLYLLFPVVTVVFGLGYLNRFGVYPFEMEAANPHFISTIGNMNWYCGYLVTVFFSIIGFWLVSKADKKWKGAIAALLVLGFATLVTQGSASGIFVLAVMLVVLYLLSMDKAEYMEGFWLLCSCLALACVVTFAVRQAFPEAITFTDGLTDLLTNNWLPILILMICVGMYVLVHKGNVKKNYPIKFFRTVGYIGAGLAILLLIGYIFLLTINTLKPGSIGPLSELGAFIFDGSWASNRGATYMAGVQTFLDQNFIHKLFGVGPDCMAMHLYTKGSDEIKMMLEKQFLTQVLTNAHCEWLTVLANTGLVGAVGYIGMIVSAIVRFVKERDRNSLVFGCGLGLLAFTVNNIFSFQQAMNTTTMFLVLGLGEALQKQRK